MPKEVFKVLLPFLHKKRVFTDIGEGLNVMMSALIGIKKAPFYLEWGCYILT